MKLRIVLDEGAKMPVRAHPQDAGMDLFTREDLLIPARGGAVRNPKADGSPAGGSARFPFSSSSGSPSSRSAPVPACRFTTARACSSRRSPSSPFSPGWDSPGSGPSAAFSPAPRRF